MRNNIKVSVVTVAYNSERFIEETFKCIEKQTYKNIQYIVIDGGSTDGTIDLIKKYEHIIDYWISEPDTGMYNAINKGFQKADGAIYGYINSDDLYYDDAIECAVKEYIRNPYDLLYGHLNFFDENSAFLYDLKMPSFSKQMIAKQQRLPFNQQSAFWSRRAFEKYDGFDEKLKLAADFKFLYQVLLDDFLISKRIPKLLGKFRIHGESLSQVQKGNMDIETELTLKELGLLDNTALGVFNKKFVELLFKLFNWKKYIAYNLLKKL